MRNVAAKTFKQKSLRHFFSMEDVFQRLFVVRKGFVRVVNLIELCILTIFLFVNVQLSNGESDLCLDSKFGTQGMPVSISPCKNKGVADQVSCLNLARKSICAASFSFFWYLEFFLDVERRHSSRNRP